MFLSHCFLTVTVVLWYKIVLLKIIYFNWTVLPLLLNSCLEVFKPIIAAGFSGFFDLKMLGLDLLVCTNRITEFLEHQMQGEKIYYSVYMLQVLNVEKYLFLVFLDSLEEQMPSK